MQAMFLSRVHRLEGGASDPPLPPTRRPRRDLVGCPKAAVGGPTSARAIVHDAARGGPGTADASGRVLEWLDGDRGGRSAVPAGSARRPEPQVGSAIARSPGAGGSSNPAKEGR